MVLGMVSRKRKRNLWIRPVTTWIADDLISCLMIELRQDERKFPNFTRMKPETFDYILLLAADIIVKSDTHFRRSIPPE
jgi:hypothetical protein